MANPKERTEVAVHPKGGFPAFRSDTFAGQIVWLAISFGLLYYLMAKMALPKVASVLETRRTRIAADLDEAARAKQDSEVAAAAYEMALSTARAKAAALAKEAHDRLGTEAAQERHTLEVDLAAKLETAERTIADRKSAAMSSVRDIAAEATSAIFERLTGTIPDRGMIDAALASDNRP